MAKQLFIVMILLIAIHPVNAAEYVFCLQLNRVANAGMLKDYSNKQIENGLCMTSKEVVLAIAANNSYKQEICMQSAEHMMREFMKRFPNRDPKEVVGKC
jgi:hypothetical protein